MIYDDRGTAEEVGKQKEKTQKLCALISQIKPTGLKRI